MSEAEAWPIEEPEGATGTASSIFVVQPIANFDDYEAPEEPTRSLPGETSSSPTSTRRSARRCSTTTARSRSSPAQARERRGCSTRRIARILADGVPPVRILAITFTNKAADEMRKRVVDLVGDQARTMWISTFHSACVRILRREAEHTKYRSGFSIYDDADSRRLLDHVIDDLGIDRKRFPSRAVAGAISQAKSEILDAEAYGARAYTIYEERIAQIFAEYEQRLVAANAMDFDDLLSEVVRLFRRDPEVLERYQSRFFHVLVDEYQDTNRAQNEIVTMIGARHRNVCVVGDSDQSIYRFRGAEVRNLLDFELAFPEATTIVLDQNYRSTQTILDAANAVIGNNLLRDDKALWSALGAGEPIRRYRAGDERDEATYRRQRDRHASSRAGDRARRDRGLLPDERPEQGDRAGPCRPRPALQGHRRDALLRPPRDPRRARLPPDHRQPRRRGVDETGAERPAPRRRRHEHRQVGRRSHASTDLVPGRARPRRRRRGSTARRSPASRRSWRFVTTSPQLANEPPELILTELLERSGYLAELAVDAAAGGSVAIDAEGRIENLGELVEVTSHFEDLPTLLETIALVAATDDLDDSGGRVSLMTLHAAKGLEFRAVFLTGLEEGIFPHDRALSDSDELEEERRLCYVGITRARERLYITHTWVRTLYGQTQGRHHQPLLKGDPRRA